MNRTGEYIPSAVLEAVLNQRDPNLLMATPDVIQCVGELLNSMDLRIATLQKNLMAVQDGATASARVMAQGFDDAKRRAENALQKANEFADRMKAERGDWEKRQADLLAENARLQEKLNRVTKRVDIVVEAEIPQGEILAKPSVGQALAKLQEEMGDVWSALDAMTARVDAGFKQDRKSLQQVVERTSAAISDVNSRVTALEEATAEQFQQIAEDVRTTCGICYDQGQYWITGPVGSLVAVVCSCRTGGFEVRHG